jgi:hypothetical protein
VRPRRREPVATAREIRNKQARACRSNALQRLQSIRYTLGALDRSGGVTAPLGKQVRDAPPPTTFGRLHAEICDRPQCASAPWRFAQMAELPLEPMMAKLVLSASKMDCLDEVRLSLVSHALPRALTPLRFVTRTLGCAARGAKASAACGLDRAVRRGRF